MVVQSQPQDLLKAIDPELPFLAAMAAVELDNLLLDRPSPLSSVALLARKLQNSSARIGGSDCQRRLVDLPEIEVLSSIVYPAGIFPSMTLSDLAFQASKIAGQLQIAGEGKGENDTIAESRAFCVALSRCASRYMQSTLEMGPSEHPWS